MRYFLVLFICYLFDFGIGTGIFVLLPVYASKFGASPSFIGNYLASASIAIALGSLLGGWLADKFQRRKYIYISICMLDIPIFFLMTLLTNIWQLVFYTIILWFSGGIKLMMLFTLLGLYSKKSNRRKMFTLFHLFGVLGSLMTSLSFGPIADILGYRSLFYFITLLSLGVFILSFFLRDIKKRKYLIAATKTAQNVRFGKLFYLFLIASTCAWIGSAVFQVGRSIVMNLSGFSSTHISHTMSISSIVILPLIIGITWLLDHVKHKPLLIYTYVLQIIFLVILANASILWHFWIASIVMGVFYILVNSVGQTITTDIVPKKSLGKALALYNTTLYLGSILGDSYIGFAIDKLGNSLPFMIAAILPIVALILIIPVKLKNKQ
ncbi:MFS transporter [Candidatus Margulisiibacteriota bacterium]